MPVARDSHRSPHGCAAAQQQDGRRFGWLAGSSLSHLQIPKSSHLGPAADLLEEDGQKLVCSSSSSTERKSAGNPLDSELHQQHQKSPGERSSPKSTTTCNNYHNNNHNHAKTTQAIRITTTMTSPLRPVASAALLLAALCLGVSAGSMAEHQSAGQLMSAQFESPAYQVISDEDRTLMQHIKNQEEDNFANFKDVDEVHKFLDKVKLLFQKHPKNVAFAHGDLKELHKFLSQEMVTRLIRVDTTPFEMPISDEKMAYAQKAIDEDELTRKLFGGPVRSLVEEAKKQSNRVQDDGNHRDGNFFVNFWCKISGNCNSN